MPGVGRGDDAPALPAAARPPQPARARPGPPERAAPAPTPLRQLNLRHLLATEPPEIDWIWEGYIERGTVCQLHGDGGAGKTLLALSLIRAAVEGQAFLGHPTTAIRAMVIDGENPPSEIHRRLHRLDVAVVVDRLAFWTAEQAILDADSERRLMDAVTSEAAELVLLDSQRALWAGLES